VETGPLRSKQFQEVGRWFLTRKSLSCRQKKGLRVTFKFNENGTENALKKTQPTVFIPRMFVTARHAMAPPEIDDA